MASVIVNQGLQMIGDQASGVAGEGADIQTMSVDDSSTAFAAGDTALDSGGAVSNEFDAALDSTPTRSSQTVSHVMTLGTGDYNGNIVRRIALHNDTAANVTTSSTALIAGVDGLSLTKASSFSLQITFDLTYTSA